MELMLEAMRYVNAVAFVGLAVACVLVWRSNRTRPAKWAAVTFGSIGAICLIGLTLNDPDTTGWNAVWVKALVSLLILFPYFLYRFAESFEAPGQRLARLIHGSTLLLVATTFVLPYFPEQGAAEPVWFVAWRYGLMLQWSLLFSVVGFRLWRAGRHQPTVLRRRMRVLAMGSIGLNVATLSGPLTSPEEVSALAVGLKLLPLAAAALFYIGLAPPAWLLHLWRRPEALAFQAAIGGLLTARTEEELGRVFLPPSVDLVGAKGGVLLSGSGRIISQHGKIATPSMGFQALVDVSAAEVPQGLHRIHLRSGAIVLWMSPYAPFFGRAELEMTEGLGHFADIALERCLLSDQQKESEGALAHQAQHDSLTGLPNRSFLMDHLTAELAGLDRRTPTALSIQFLDLDRFKFINDGIDHAAGDELLISVGERLTEAVRNGDVVARFGGDEFVIVAEVDGELEALELAGRIGAAVAAPVWIGDRELTVTASIGVVVVTERREPEAVLRDADAAMYRAKELGRARVALFDEDLQHRGEDRLDLERALRSAVPDGALRLHYQPTIRLSDGAVVGVEALFRWQHPRLGLLQPESFISVAEESDLIGALGSWVLREACCQAQSWKQTIPGLDEFMVWVNVSAAQFDCRDMAQEVADALQISGLDPSSLGLEITESVFINQTEGLSDAFEALREMGVSIAIDDFGTGFSSLGALKRFPADVLKIDGSFVKGLGIDPEDTAIVTACVALGHAMGMTTIAEAVETAEQQARLITMGCPYGQGFHYSEALPGLEMESYLRTHLMGRRPAPRQSRPSRCAHAPLALVRPEKIPA